ncbi:hypothetical protein [Pseudonocardia nigra]|uniref:hypothetical protein n=1 Tax=Pseudonocardia nigra TaxID=1921578 RepID=UPI001C5EA6E4|nr:hypothetical protein [Pseudonocardia nigra]
MYLALIFIGAAALVVLALVIALASTAADRARSVHGSPTRRRTHTGSRSGGSDSGGSWGGWGGGGDCGGGFSGGGGGDGGGGGGGGC